MTSFCVKHPVPTWMFFTIFVLMGLYALPRLQVEAIPEVKLPTLTVETFWNGASPRAIQRSITIPIEEAARKVHGVEKVVSTSRSGRSQVEVEFRRDINIDFARVDLNEELGVVRRSLPLNAGQPQIRPYVPEEFQSKEFFTFSLESDHEPNQLREFAETWVVPQLLALEGVADAQVLGGADPILKVYLDRQKLNLYSIATDEVFASLDRLDELDVAGVIQDSGAERIVALRQPVDIRRIENAVVAERGGRTFKLAMLGHVEKDFEDPVYFIRNNGQNVVQVSVEKRSGSNTISVSKTLRKNLPKIQADVPFSMTFDIDEDEGEELESKLRELVYRSLAILFLLFVLLLLSLRQVRLTTIIIGSIFFSVVISLSLFYFLNISVNFITISGLTVCFGLILDNSILVLDSIHRRLGAIEKAEAANLSRAAKLRVSLAVILDGSHEVLFPILATTLTTIVAFVSFIFLSGRLALFYIPLGVSVATALVASLFVAFGWVPMVLHGAWAAPLARRSADGPNDVDNPEALAKFTEELPDLNAKPSRLERMIGWNQRLWWTVLPLAIALFIWSGHVYNTKVIKGGFWRLPDIEQILLWMQMPPGTDITLTTETLRQFENSIMPLDEGAHMRSQTFGNQAFFRIEFDDDVRQTEIPIYYRTVLMDEADKLAGISIFISGFSDTPYINGSFRGSMLNSLIKITGYNSRTLEEIANGALAQIEPNRRVRNARVTTGSRFGSGNQEEVVVSIDREKLASHGLTVLEVVTHIRRLFGVDFPWSMLVDGEHERLQLSFLDSETMEYSDAVETTIQTQFGETVRLADLTRIETVPLSGEITREDQRYSTFLNWDFVGTDKMRTAYIHRVLASMDLPYGYEAEEGQQQFFTREEEEEMTLAIVLALAFIFMVLAALFESVTLPVMVLMSVPMALVGVFHAFWWTDSSFDSSARIGLILLFGIVVNNAILLLSRFRTEATLTLKARLGYDPTPDASIFPKIQKQLGGSDLWQLPKSERATLLRRAVARGTRIRLRSILLTSSTTIVGLLPLLIHFRDTDDKDIWENLALASIGGLVSSTILILVLIPAMYYMSIRLNWLWRSLWQKIRRRESVDAVADPSGVQ